MLDFPKTTPLLRELDKNNKETDPALKVGATTSTVAGVLALIAFLMPELLTERQTTLILTLSAFILPIVTAAFTRGRVWSPASVQTVVDEAIEEALKALSLLKDNKGVIGDTPKPILDKSRSLTPEEAKNLEEKFKDL